MTPDEPAPPHGERATWSATPLDRRFGTPNVQPRIIDHEDQPAGDPAAEPAAEEASEPVTAAPAAPHPGPPAEPPPPEPRASEPPRKTAPPPAPPAPSGGGSNLLTLVLFLAAAGGIYWTWSHPRAADTASAGLATVTEKLTAEHAATAQLAEQVQALQQQAQALGDRLDKVEKSAASAATQQAAAPAAPDTGDLRQRIEALAQRVDALGSRPAGTDTPTQGAAPQVDTAALQQAAQSAGQQAAQQEVAAATEKLQQALAAQTAQLGARLDQIQAAQKSTEDALDGRVGRLEQGAGQVESAADRAARLARVQAAVVALDAGHKLGALPGAPPALARFADTAPPTEAALRESYPAAAAQARAVSRPDLSNQSFWARTLSRLQQSVTVRQGDDVIVGDPAAGTLAAAQAKLDNGDLRGAVQVLGALRGPAADAMKDWVGQAQALLAARDALGQMAARG